MTEASIPSSRVDIAAALELARDEFHAMASGLTSADWARPSSNSAWTNGELLAHITFGYILVPRLWWVLQLFGRLPMGWSKAFARLLNASTRTFNRINAIVPRLIARAYDRDALVHRYDRTHAIVLHRVATANETDWRRGMYYPKHWDPRFMEFMRFEDVARWSVLHLRHHRTQLTQAQPR